MTSALLNDGQIIDHEYGADFDGLVGYDFGGFRLEAEVGYKRAQVDQLRSTVDDPGVHCGRRRGSTLRPARIPMLAAARRR